MKYLKLFFIISSVLFSCAKINVLQKITPVDNAMNWPMFAGGPSRANHYQGDLTTPLNLAWHFNATSAIENHISVVDGIVYTGTKDGRIFALNIKNGDKLGNIKMDVASTVAVSDSSLIIARRYGDETLFKYDLKKSKFAWEVDAGDISSEPLIFGNSVVITALYNHIDLYDLDTGVRIWQTKIKKQIRSSPAISENLIVFGDDDGVVYAVNKLDGAIKWKFETGASVVAIPAISNRTVFVGSSDKNFYALSLDDGSLKWTFSADGQILQTAAVYKNHVIFGSTDSFLYCLKSATGQLDWKFEAQSVISTSPVIFGEKVVFGSLDFHYYIVDLKSGNEIWKYKTKGRIRTTPVIWGDYLIGGSENNHIYAFKSTGVE